MARSAAAGWRCGGWAGATPGLPVGWTTSPRLATGRPPATSTGLNERGARRADGHHPSSDHGRRGLDHGPVPLVVLPGPGSEVGTQLGAVDRGSGDHHAGHPDPALREAEQGGSGHADALPGAAGAAEEVQGPQRPGLPRGDDTETMALY